MPLLRNRLARYHRLASRGESPLLVVPSVIVAEESNVLINPAHAAIKSVTATKLRAWQYDRRLKQSRL